MRAKHFILIFMSLLLLIGTVSAAGMPDTVIITTDKPWITADNVDQSIITVLVTNTTMGYSGAVAGVTVNLYADPLYGNMSPIQVITNVSGMASSTFNVKTKSGEARIFANITTPIVSHSIIQNIDHNSAYYADFTHPLSGTVANEVPFNVSLTDQYRNPVDNRRGNHIISLHVNGPAPDDCGFAEAGFAHDITRTLDGNGNTSVRVRLTSRIGDNNIAMDGYESIPNQLEQITANARGVPFSMTQLVLPSGNPPTIPADGSGFFTLMYTLFDVYGNPTGNQSVWVNTSVPGEERQFLSNNFGQVTIQYGPRSSIGEIDITTTAVANSTVTSTQKVKFKDTGAEIISLTANPDTMASRDVPPSASFSSIIATVADRSGNAVSGESVTFAIMPGSITYDGTYNVTAAPRLLNSSAITDVNGQAAVQFLPGEFTTNGNHGYNASATGHCNVIATWNATQKIVPLTWKNYPYISVSTSVTPLTVGINQTIDVTIGFKGDGWLMMQPVPIDAVLAIDRSGSMGRNEVSPGVTRMDAAKGAALTFVNKMTEGTDQVGVVSYSYENDVDQNMGSNSRLGHPFTNIRTKIQGLNADGGTAMRTAFKVSIDQMIQYGRPSSVRAVILMTDGNWNNAGSPLAVGKGYEDIPWVTSNRDIDVGGNRYNGFSSLATNFEDEDYRWYPGLGGSIAQRDTVNVVRMPAVINENTGVQTSSRSYRTLNGVRYSDDGKFTQQNMSVYAKENNIRLYTLSFAQTIPPSERDALITLANSTGGFYRNAPTQADLENVYAEIATDLKDTAGVNTSMNVDFQNINVTGVSMNGSQVYDYVYSPSASTKINWQNGTTTVPAIDQSADWAADNKLDFTIGTIKVGQIWNATFRLKVKQSGIIDVFGKNSTVSFNGGTERMTIPQIFITVIPQLNVTEITQKTIILDDLMITGPGEITVLLPVSWNTTYTGNKTLTEKVYYRLTTGPWIQFKEIVHPYPFGPNTTTTNYGNFAQLDVRNLQPGNYQIKVYATATDAPDAEAETGLRSIGGQGKHYIRLEAPPGGVFQLPWDGTSLSQYFK